MASRLSSCGCTITSTRVEAWTISAAGCAGCRRRGSVQASDALVRPHPGEDPALGVHKVQGIVQLNLGTGIHGVGAQRLPKRATVLSLQYLSLKRCRRSFSTRRLELGQLVASGVEIIA